MIFPESKLAHYWLDPLARIGPGAEIGASQHNDFNIQNCINIDYTNDLETCFKKEEIKLCGSARKVDVVAFADDLPFPDNHFLFILNSHVFEHQCNPIKTLKEWHRVVMNGGVIYSVIPHFNALESDKLLPITSIEHQMVDFIKMENYETHPIPPGNSKYGHYHRYTFESYPPLIKEFNEIFGYGLEIVESVTVDDKVSNGYVFIHRVHKK